MIQKICAYDPQTKRPDTEKVRFYNEMASKLDFGSSSEIIVTLGDFNRHVGKCAEGFEGVYEENGIGKRNTERRLLEFCDESCKAAVIARVRIGWVRFRECGELLLGNRFPLRMKGKVYRCCVRSAILQGSEARCFNENGKAILARTERAMVRAMCGQKVVDRKTTEEQRRAGVEGNNKPISNSERY